MKSNTLTAIENFIKRHWFIIFNGFFCIALDQLLKYFARTSSEYTLYLLPNLIGWEYFENPGIAFGIPIPQFVVIPLSVIIIIAGLIFLKKRQENKIQMLGATLLITGAVSNLIDRSIYGITIDYIRILTSIFNLADLLIVIGGILLLKKTRTKSINS